LLSTPSPRVPLIKRSLVHVARILSEEIGSCIDE
jgi:hypothetical protein